MSFRTKPVLTLNADMMPIGLPISTTSFEQAINRIFRGHIDHKLNGFYVVSSYDQPVQTMNRGALKQYDLENWPSVVACRRYLKRSDRVPFNRETLYVRDQGKCAYCGTELVIDGTGNKMTYDHYLPQKRGGKLGWENTVSACGKCNSMKGHNMPEGIWRLHKHPWEPSIWEWSTLRRNLPLKIYDENWMQFLGDWKGEVTLKSPKYGM